MTIGPIPVTFHVRADPRPELIAARRRRVRPYRLIAQSVGLLALVGAGAGFLAGGLVAGGGATRAAPPGGSVTASARVPSAISAGRVESAPSFPVWTPQKAATAPGFATVPPGGVDMTPVASIPAPTRPPAFPPVVRAPDYAGFRVVAGN